MTKIMSRKVLDSESGVEPKFKVAQNTEPDNVLAGILSCLFYTLCSVATVVANKFISFGMEEETKAKIPELSVILLQCAIAVILVETARFFKWVDYRSFNLDTAKLWLPVNILFIGMLCSSFVCYIYLSVPIITIFKNLTNLATVAGDWYFFNEKASSMTIAAIAIMTLGAIMAGINDLEFNAIGYFWMGVNCLFTASYTLYMRYASVNIKISRFGMVYYNNLLSVAILLPMCIFNKEFQRLKNPAILTSQFVTSTLVAGVFGFGLNFASLWCVSATSATTYAVVGSLNKIPVTFLGFFLFHAQMTNSGIIFVCMATLGGFLFAYSKLPVDQK